MERPKPGENLSDTIRELLRPAIERPPLSRTTSEVSRLEARVARLEAELATRQTSEALRRPLSDDLEFRVATEIFRNNLRLRQRRLAELRERIDSL